MAKIGRPGKGDRIPTMSRLPRGHRAVYEAAARAADVPLGDYIALMLARAHELEEPEYIHRNRDQAELPLGA